VEAAPRFPLRIRLGGAVACAGYFAFLVSRAAFSVAGSDSSGYFNTARSLAAGTLVETIPIYQELGLDPDRVHLVVPLGFVPGPRPGTIAPFYPVGVPLHMLVFAAIGGWAIGPFIVSPLAAALCVLLIARLGRDLGLSVGACMAAATMLAACPVFLFQALQPMSDVLALLWSLAAVLAAVRAQRRMAWAATSGIAFGIAVLVRPTSLLVIFPVLAALPWRGRLLALFALAALPAASLLFFYDATCYGSPLRTGYGAGGALADFAWSNFPPRFRHYSRWLARMLAPPLVGWLVYLFRAGKERSLRLLLVAWFLPFFVVYCFYGPYETWWYTRYLLPAIPALLLGMLLFLRRESSVRAA
jgi:4-amino-4-deoxy-L-arabinose transferase-like glycosyltransferase